MSCGDGEGKVTDAHQHVDSSRCQHRSKTYLAVGVDEDVPGLDVAMKDIGRVDVLQREWGCRSESGSIEWDIADMRSGTHLHPAQELVHEVLDVRIR